MASSLAGDIFMIIYVHGTWKTWCPKKKGHCATVAVFRCSNLPLFWGLFFTMDLSFIFTICMPYPLIWHRLHGCFIQETTGYVNNKRYTIPIYVCIVTTHRTHSCQCSHASQLQDCDWGRDGDDKEGRTIEYVRSMIQKSITVR